LCYQQNKFIQVLYLFGGLHDFNDQKKFLKCKILLTFLFLTCVNLTSSFKHHTIFAAFNKNMGHKKLIRFQAIKEFPNVLEHPQGMQGKWGNHFNNHHKITLELACGKGEYAVGLGRMYTERNFIGVDIKGNRIWRGAITALDEGLTNVAFLRTEIDKLPVYFGKEEVSEIWITFPDPQLRLSKAKKRLTHPKFLRIYQQFLQPNSIIHLKTDSPDLYQFTKTVINLFNLPLLKDFDDAYNQGEIDQELQIKTYYESLDIAKSKRIHYLQFQINKPLPLEIDEQLKFIINGTSLD